MARNGGRHSDVIIQRGTEFENFFDGDAPGGRDREKLFFVGKAFNGAFGGDFKFETRFKVARFGLDAEFFEGSWKADFDAAGDVEVAGGAAVEAVETKVEVADGGTGREVSFMYPKKSGLVKCDENMKNLPPNCVTSTK